MNTIIRATAVGLVASTALTLAGCGSTTISMRAASTATPAPGTRTTAVAKDVAADPTEAGARAFLDKSFGLYASLQFEKACTYTQSKAYLAVDTTCVEGSRQNEQQMKQYGMSYFPKKTDIQLSTPTRGKAVFTWEVQGHTFTTFQYLRYEGGRWWLTGDEKTGDLG